MKDNNVILEVKDLHKSFGEQEVLKGISTEVNRGDVIAIIGPSGCGKSTFLRSLNLLETPTSGQILFEGTDLTDKSTDINVTRQKIGMVFQQPRPENDPEDIAGGSSYFECRAWRQIG